MQTVQVLTGGIEVVLNQLLYNPRIEDVQIKTARLQLADKAVRVKIDELSAEFFLLFSVQQVDVLAQWQGDVDCHIAMPVGSLPMLRERQKLPQMIKEGKLSVEGDNQVVQNVSLLLDRVEWDLADLLAPFFGDILAYAISHRCNRVGAFIQKNVTQQRKNVKEVLKEEWYKVPSPLEFAHFNDCVMDLERDLNSLSQRLEKLADYDDTL